MTEPDPLAGAEFADVGPPLLPAEAGLLEYELERRGIEIRLRFCGKGADGREMQAVQVAPADLAAAIAARQEVLPPAAVPEAPPPPRSHRLRNAAIAAALGLVASLRLVRLVRVPKGGMTALVVLGVAGAIFAAAFGLTKEPPASGP